MWREIAKRDRYLAKNAPAAKARAEEAIGAIVRSLVPSADPELAGLARTVRQTSLKDMPRFPVEALGTLEDIARELDDDPSNQTLRDLAKRLERTSTPHRSTREAAATYRTETGIDVAQGHIHVLSERVTGYQDRPNARRIYGEERFEAVGFYLMWHDRLEAERSALFDEQLAELEPHAARVIAARGALSDERRAIHREIKGYSERMERERQTAVVGFRQRGVRRKPREPAHYLSHKDDDPNDR